RLPYPIVEVRLPKVTRQNIIEIGMRSSEVGRGVRPVPEESLMLTGDENIVDINFVVFWRIKDAQKYLFNIQKPDVTIKEVAESAMRDIVGQSNIQPLLTAARQKTEQAVQKLTQEVLDSYGRCQYRPNSASDGRSNDPGHIGVERSASSAHRQGSPGERSWFLR